MPLLAALWLSCVVALDLCAVDEFPPIGVSEAQTQLREMEQVMEARFRHMAGRDDFEAASGAISNFNASCQTQRRVFEDWRTKLDDELRAICRQEEKVKTMDAGLKASAPRQGDRPAVEAHEARIGQRNQVVEKLNARNSAYKVAVESYNGAIQKFNSESESQRGKLEGAAEAAAGRANEQQRWVMSRSDVDFYRRANALTARLLRSFGGAVAGKRLECVNAAASLRRELGELAARQERQRSNGLVIVQALLGGRVSCHMIVDTGASTVTISSSIASMLGLTNRSAEKVEITLAGGLVIKGHMVTLPTVNVEGQEVAGVDAIVIPETSCGVDGLLGHSYLDHFSYQFDKSRNPPVRFWRKGSGGGGP